VEKWGGGLKREGNGWVFFSDGVFIDYILSISAFLRSYNNDTRPFLCKLTGLGV